MGKRAEKEQTAIERYAEGKEIPQISVELGVSENSLRHWRKRAGSEWDEARAICRRGMIASMEDVGSRLRRSREIAAALGGQAGLEGQGQMGQVVNELLRSLLYDLSAKVQTEGVLGGEEMSATIDQLKGLALTMHRLEGAANLNLKREQEIRTDTLQKAAAQVTSSTKKGGLSDEAADEIRKKILGIGA